MLAGFLAVPSMQESWVLLCQNWLAAWLGMLALSPSDFAGFSVWLSGYAGWLAGY
jgi:hypothetical protein